jgi:hypothetical protein
MSTEMDILIIEAFTYLADNKRIRLKVTQFTPKAASTGTVVMLNDTDKAVDGMKNRVIEFIKEDKAVIVVEPRGLGQTQGVGAAYYDHKLFGTDGVDYYFAYLLGRSYVGMRTEDLLAVIRELPQKPVEVVASGETAELVALHAAALEPALIKSVKLDTPVRTWHDVVKAGSVPYPITNVVHGALTEYDVSDLLRLARTVGH